MEKQELDKLIERLQGMEPDDSGTVDDNAIVSVLHQAAHPVYQTVFDKGHGVGLGKGNAPDLQAKLDAANAKVTNLETKIRDLEDKAPDVQKIRTQYEEQLAEANAQVEKLETKHAEELRAERLGRQTTALQAKLAGRLDPDYAEILTSKPEIRDRIRVDNGTVEVLQKGRDIPFAATAERSAIDLLADELVNDAPAKWRLKDGDAGGGGGGGAARSTGFDYEKLRTTVKEKSTAEAGSRGPSGAERMGMSSG